MAKQEMTENELMEKGLNAIKSRAIHDIIANTTRFVNKLIYYGEDLMIVGYGFSYKVADYGKTWRLEDEIKRIREVTFLKKQGKEYTFKIVQGKESKTIEKKALKLSEYPVEDLRLSTRVFNALTRQQLYTLGDIVVYIGTTDYYQAKERLLRIRCLGSKSVGEIIQKLERYGYGFKKN